MDARINSYLSHDTCCQRTRGDLTRIRREIWWFLGLSEPASHLEADAGAQEAQRGYDEPLLAAPQQSQDLADSVGAQDVVLDAVLVVLHAEAEQVHKKAERAGRHRRRPGLPILQAAQREGEDGSIFTPRANIGESEEQGQRRRTNARAIVR